eukprot:SAG11_NODE_23279_length_383_cov_2.181507_1_plen_55_part_10
MAQGTKFSTRVWHTPVDLATVRTKFSRLTKFTHSSSHTKFSTPMAQGTKFSTRVL